LEPVWVMDSRTEGCAGALGVAWATRGGGAGDAAGTGATTAAAVDSVVGAGLVATRSGRSAVPSAFAVSADEGSGFMGSGCTESVVAGSRSTAGGADCVAMSTFGARLFGTLGTAGSPFGASAFAMGIRSGTRDVSAFLPPGASMSRVRPVAPSSIR
jgi:hypothetical protein